MNEPSLETTFRTVREAVARLLSLMLRSLQHWPVIIVAAMLGLVAAYMAPKFVKPVYESQTVLIYRETVQTEALVGGNQRQDSWAKQSAAFRDALTSRSNITEVIEDLKLYPAMIASVGMIDAVEEFRRNLTLVMRDGNTIFIAFRANDSKTAVRVVERLVDDLKHQPNQSAAEQAAATKSFLEIQLKSVADDLAAKETELATFLTQHPEFAQVGRGPGAFGAVAGKADKAMPVQQTGNAGARLATLKRQRQRLQQQLDEPNAPLPPPAAQVSPETKRAIATAEAEVSRARDELRKRQESFTEKHPDVIAAQQKLTDAQAKLASTKRAAIATPGLPQAYQPKTDTLQIQAQIEEIDKAIIVEQRAQAREPRSPVKQTQPAPVDDTSQAIAALETRWVALNRDVDTARGRHDEVQRRLFAASTIESLQASGGTGRIATVDPPIEPPRPSARGPRRTAVMAFGVVLLFGFGVAFLLAVIDDRLYDAYDVRSLNLGPIAHFTPRYRELKGGRTSAG